MATETILQHPILANFALPFLLIFFIVFALLEKTKILGDGKTQLNALTSFVIGLIFVGAVFPKAVVGNLILFFTIALVVVFIVLLLWGFAIGGDLKEKIIEKESIKWVVGIVIVVAVIIALVWSSGAELGISEGGFYDLLFKQDWSSEFWTNFAFVVIIAAALAVVMRKST
jgi:hypothetical protein